MSLEAFYHGLALLSQCLRLLAERYAKTMAGWLLIFLVWSTSSSLSVFQALLLYFCVYIDTLRLFLLVLWFLLSETGLAVLYPHFLNSNWEAEAFDHLLKENSVTTELIYWIRLRLKLYQCYIYSIKVLHSHRNPIVCWKIRLFAVKWFQSAAVALLIRSIFCIVVLVRYGGTSAGL